MKLLETFFSLKRLLLQGVSLVLQLALFYSVAAFISNSLSSLLNLSPPLRLASLVDVLVNLENTLLTT